MASKFQNRLIGTIVLVAIGVIFLPDLFDGKKEHYQEQFASIPLQPDIADQEEYAVIPEPEPEPEFEDVILPQEPVSAVIGDEGFKLTSDSKMAAVVKSAEPLAVKPQPVELPKTNNVNSGWVVQLGVFRNFENAHRLVADLRKAGFQAHVFPKQPKSGDLARVVVGPDVSKDKLSDQAVQLEKLTGLKGQLVRFNPLNP